MLERGKKIYRGMVASVAMVLAAQEPARAVAPSGAWTTVGSAGTVDEASLARVVMSGPSVNVDPAAPAETAATLRYNVVATAGVDAFSLVEMRVRYRDKGVGNRVVLRLREVNLATGATTTRMTFDSDLFAQQSTDQTRSITSCASSFPFDFAANAYYVEASITGTGSGGFKPTSGSRLTGIQILPTLC